MISSVSQTDTEPKEATTPKAPPSLGMTILLLMVFTCLIVGLFGLLIFLFISGAQRLEWPPLAYIVIFVTVLGIFAWLVKRITDTVASLSRFWFPEDLDKEN
jgi:drug/metabolite transporter (DMT)-like permease